MKLLMPVAILMISAATPAVAGPPWIGVEIRPYNSGTIVIRTFHHGTANPMALRGTAFGLVDGRRVSIPLTFEPLAEGNNSYTVAHSWGEDGVWVISIATGADAHGGAAAVVMLDRSGAATVRFPRTFDGRSREASAGEIETLLATLDASASPRLARTGWFSLPGLRMLLPLALIGLLGYVAARVVIRAARRWRSGTQPASA